MLRHIETSIHNDFSVDLILLLSVHVLLNGGHPLHFEGVNITALFLRKIRSFIGLCRETKVYERLWPFSC